MPHGWSSKAVSNFGGPSKNALASRNMRYFFSEYQADSTSLCKVRTRAGHGVAFTPGAAVKHMASFLATDPILSTPFNRVIFYTGAAVKTYDQDTATIFDMNPAFTLSAAVKIAVAQQGTKAYIAGYDQNGIGVTEGRVVDPSNQADKLFEPAPLKSAVTIVLSEPVTAGNVIAGTHKVAFVITTRNGFTTPPGPLEIVTAVFAPETIVSTGGKTIKAHVAGTWPTAALSVAMIMSPTDDPDTYYFVAGATFAVPGGSSFGIDVVLDVDDATLIASPPAIDYFGRLSRNPLTDGGPFLPSFVCEYGNRMVYGAGDRVYISDPDDPQAISTDQNVQFLPGLRIIKGAFSYRDGNLYLLSDTGTYSLNDTGGKPVSWVSPQLIDGKIGVPAFSAIVRDPTGDTIYVANPSGLRVFSNGSYSAANFAADKFIPLSFFQGDWSRINWAYAHLIDIVNDAEDQTVRVLVPIDSSVVPNAEFAFDYKKGKNPDFIAFSNNTAPGRSCMALIPSLDEDKFETWFGPSSGAGTVWRKDKLLITDEGVAIAGQVWESSRLIPVPQIDVDLTFHGAHFTARGTANLKTIAYSPEHRKRTPDKFTNLATLPDGERVYRQWELSGPNESIEFSADSGWFELTDLEAYYSKWVD